MLGLTKGFWMMVVAASTLILFAVASFSQAVLPPARNNGGASRLEETVYREPPSPNDPPPAIGDVSIRALSSGVTSNQATQMASLLEQGRGLLNKQADLAKLNGDRKAAIYQCLAELHYQLASDAFTRGDAGVFSSEFHLFGLYLSAAHMILEPPDGVVIRSDGTLTDGLAIDTVMALAAPANSAR